MMELKIDISEYLSSEEIKECCKDAIKSAIYGRYSRSEAETDRLITNLAYEFVWKMIDEEVGGGLEKMIRSKTIEAIEKLSEYSVFRVRSAWDRQESIGHKILEEEVSASRPLIKARVKQIISDYPFHELDRDEIGYVVHDCIMERLFGDTEG